MDECAVHTHAFGLGTTTQARQRMAALLGHGDSWSREIGAGGLCRGEVRFRPQARIRFINRDAVDVKSLGSNILFVGPLHGSECNPSLLEIVEVFQFGENTAIQIWP